MSDSVIQMENLTIAQLKAGYEIHEKIKSNARARYYRWKENNPEKWIENVKYYNEKKKEKRQALKKAEIPKD
jgi:hypothetical protein